MKQRDPKTGHFVKTFNELIKKCEICSVDFLCKNIHKYKTGRFCSKKCLGKFNSVNKHGQKPYEMTEEIKDKIGKSKAGIAIWGGTRLVSWMIGDKNPNWQGDNVKYRELHHWIDQWNGKADHCENCGDKSKHRYHWANIDHKYKRVLEDYIQLCPKCHYKYDKDVLSCQRGRKKREVI
jgi:hypothetical protein